MMVSRYQKIMTMLFLYGYTSMFESVWVLIFVAKASKIPINIQIIFALFKFLSLHVINEKAPHYAVLHKQTIVWPLQVMKVSYCMKHQC